MPSLKEYRTRIAGVKSTKRITSAMKMVAAAKLRRAQAMTIATRPYSNKLEELIQSLTQMTRQALPEVMAGRPNAKTRLYVVNMTDRGLCGALNANLLKLIHADLKKTEARGLESRFLLIGRKATLLLGRRFADQIVQSYDDVNKPLPNISQARQISDDVQALFEAGEIDECCTCYNHFVSTLAQRPTIKQIIPVMTDSDAPRQGHVYDFEPNVDVVLATLMPRYQLVQIYRGTVENYTSELAARMTSMDNATRNADKMVETLSLQYNRQRQSAITKELIEIVSGAAALTG